MVKFVRAYKNGSQAKRKFATPENAEEASCFKGVSVSPRFDVNYEMWPCKYIAVLEPELPIPECLRQGNLHHNSVHVFRFNADVPDEELEKIIDNMISYSRRHVTRSILRYRLDFLQIEYKAPYDRDMW